MEVQVAEVKTCLKCETPLSRYLIDAGAEYHIMCFPEDLWKEWIKKFEQ